LKFFNHQKKGAHVISFFLKKFIPTMPFGAIEVFWSPSDGGGVLDGNGNSLIATKGANKGVATKIFGHHSSYLLGIEKNSVTIGYAN